MIRRPPRSTLFPTRRSSDLGGGVSTDTSRTSPGAAAVAGASASRTPAPARARRASSSAARRSSILHANGPPARLLYLFYAPCARKTRLTSAEWGMRSAECQWSVAARVDLSFQLRIPHFIGLGVPLHQPRSEATPPRLY